MIAAFPTAQQLNDHQAPAKKKEGYTDREGYILAKSMIINTQGKPVKITAKIFRSLINCVLISEFKYGNCIKFPRENKRLMPKIIDFIEDHITIFQAYYNSGTRIYE